MPSRSAGRTRCWRSRPRRETNLGPGRAGEETMANAASRPEILERFTKVVVQSLRIDPSQVTEDAFLDDLGAESLDLAEITMESGEEFDILVPQKNILQAATEVFGDGVLARDGKLTEEGKRFLRRRMPEFPV